MVIVRKSEDRGHVDLGWLKSDHTFSFADYFDRNHMNFGPLRVINQDIIMGGRGFGTHGHKDMEIITYLLSGALEHKDSMGNTEIIRPGEVQRMTAGTGVEHSEYNPLEDQVTHLLQIWILPEHKGGKPGYDQKDFTEGLKSGELVLVVSQQGREGSVSIAQDVDMYVLKSKEKGARTLKTGVDRKLWLQLIAGGVEVDGAILSVGDGAKIEKTDSLQISWVENSEFILFDMIGSI